jgi:hypothetical protein
MPSAITRLKRMLPRTVIHFQSIIPPNIKNNYNLDKITNALNEAALP